MSAWPGEWVEKRRKSNYEGKNEKNEGKEKNKKLRELT
jgi:hypothetical protein